MIPIYRLSEGRDELKNNDDTFRHCLQLLHAGGTVLIFSEGVCKNEWMLRPLKKGTARLAWLALNSNIKNLVVLPVAINYASFSTLPIVVSVNANKPVQIQDIDITVPPQFFQAFNHRLANAINEKLIVKSTLFTTRKFIRVLCFLPGIVGWLTHMLYYRAVEKWVQKKTNGTVFFHSVMFGVLMFTYPVMVIGISCIIGLLINWYWAALIFIQLPVSIWCYKKSFT